MIYVDFMGHMVADSWDELHKFAADIGLKREWFQEKGELSHYDLTTQRMIQKALRNGAKLVDPREIVRKLKNGC